MLTLLADLTVPAAMSLGLVPVGALVFVLAFADADRQDFDPRPALETGRLRPVWQVAVFAGHDLNRGLATARRTARAVRADVAWTVAALLILTIPTGDQS